MSRDPVRQVDRLQGKLADICDAIGLPPGGGGEGHIVPAIERIVAERDEASWLRDAIFEADHLAFSCIAEYLDEAVNSGVVDLAKLRAAYDTACLPDKARAIRRESSLAGTEPDIHIVRVAPPAWPEGSARPDRASLIARHSLVTYMSDLSELYWCAGWMDGWENECRDTVSPDEALVLDQMEKAAGWWPSSYQEASLYRDARTLGIAPTSRAKGDGS